MMLLGCSADRVDVENALNARAVAVETIQRAAGLAHHGAYKQARVALVSTQRLLQRGMASGRGQEDYLRFVVSGEKLDAFMRESQALGDGANRDDDASKSMFQMKSLSSQAFEASWH